MIHVLTKHGLAHQPIPEICAWICWVRESLDAQVGEWIEEECLLPLDKPTAHGAGSAITYARAIACKLSQASWRRRMTTVTRLPTANLRLRLRALRRTLSTTKRRRSNLAGRHRPKHQERDERERAGKGSGSLGGAGFVSRSSRGDLGFIRFRGTIRAQKGKGGSVMPRLIDLTGQRFGFLVVESFSHRTHSYEYFWNCICDCGTKCKAWSASLKNGNKKSCGCFQRDARKTNHRVHGAYGTATWSSWSAMHRRCRGESPHHRKYYLDRGITVCDRWSDFNLFLSDMGERPTGMTLDRINNEFGYFPENCRWATALQQRHNRRDSKERSTLKKAKEVANG